MLKASRNRPGKSECFQPLGAPPKVLGRVRSIVDRGQQSARSDIASNVRYRWCRVICGGSLHGNTRVHRATDITTLSGRSLRLANLGHVYSGCNDHGKHSSAFHLRLPVETR